MTNNQKPQIEIAGLTFEWDVPRGAMTISGVPVTTLFRDSSLASLLLGFQSMVGTQRFSLALQAEGRKGTNDDWAIISSKHSFEEGIDELNRYVHVAGWGHFEIVSLNRAEKHLVMRVINSWEGCIQKALGVSWGCGLIAGKFSSYATRLFGVNCWAEQTHFFAAGDPYDEFVVRPSERSIEKDLELITETEAATRSDLESALKQLKQASAERERIMTELQDKLAVIEQQQEAIAMLSSPILQVWEGVLAVPFIGGVDPERANRMMEQLLEAIVRTKSRFAILDLTGVDAVDTSTADSFLKIIGASQLLGAKGIIAGIRPLVAQSIVALGVNLGEVSTYATLKDALKACIGLMRETR